MHRSRDSMSASGVEHPGQRHESRIHRRKRHLVLIALLLPLPFLPASAMAQDDPLTRLTLRGLDGIHLYVEALKPEIEKDGLTRAQLQQELEKEFKDAGIRLLTGDEMEKAPGKPYLYVYVHITKLVTEIKRYLFYIQVELNQDVYLLRDPSIRAVAVTWSTGGTGIDFDLQSIRKIVKRKVAEFIVAFQAVNTTRQKL